MAFERDEKVTITVQIEGDKARNELALLEGESRKLERALKEAPKGTKEWADLYKELGKNQDAQKALRTEVGLTGLTMGQLEKEARSLVKEMKNLTPGTEEYIAKSARLKEVNGRIVELKQDYKVLNDEIDKVTASTADWDDENKRATLTIKQLKEISAQLGKEIEDLVPGTKEHAAAVQKLDDVNKKINTTISEQPSRWKQAQTAIVAFVGAFSLFSLAQEAFQFLKSAVTGAIQNFREFQSAAQQLSAITGLTGKDLTYLKDQAKAVGPAMGMTAADMLKAYQLMGSAKPELLAQKEALADITKEAIALAQASGMELPEATKSLAESLNQFGEGADQASRFINTMAAGAKEGAAEINEVSASLKASGTVAKSAKLSFEQTNAVLQSLSTIALKGGEAGTMLRNVLLKLQSGAKETNPELVGMDKALENLAKQHLSTAEMAKLFGTENVVAAKHIVEHRKEIGELTTKLTGTKEAYEQAAKNTDTLDHELAKMDSTLADLSLSIGTTVIPLVTKMAQGVVNFVAVIKAVPGFIKENQASFYALGIAILGFNKNLIAATAASLVNTAQEKARAIASSLAAAADKVRAAEAARKALAEQVATVASTEATVAENAATAASGRLTVAQRLQGVQSAVVSGLKWAQTAATNALTVAQDFLNAAMRANPIGLIVTALGVLAAVFIPVYNNSQGLRASIAGLWEAMKTATLVAVQFTKAFLTMDIKGMADAMMNGGKSIADSFNKGYSDKIKEEQPKHLANHQKMVDDKKNASVKGAQEIGTAEVHEDEKTLKKKAEQAKKHREEQQKAETDLRNQTREAQIAAIADEFERERAKLRFKRDQDVAAVQESIGSEKSKSEAIKAIDAQLKVDLQKVNKDHVDKVRADQQKALELHREFQLSVETDEKRRKELDAQFKYEKERDRIQKEITNETQKAQLLTQLEQRYKQDLEQINTEFRNREREANNAIRVQEQAATIAQFDFQELQAGNNAQRLMAIKKARLDKEYEYQRENLRKEKDEELQRIQESNMSQEQKAAAQKATNDKYLADVGSAVRQHTNEMTALDRQAIEEKNQRYQAFSSAFKSLLQGDFMAFAEQSSNIVKGEKAAWQERMSENEAKYDAVADIAKEGVNFLNKLTQERLDKEIAASKKETETKLADNKKRMEEAIKAAEEQAEKEKLAAGDSAEKIKEIEEKLAQSKVDIRDSFEDEADDIRKSGATKEKALAKQKWEADKRAQVATAIISGAQAALKALASGIFPVNLVFAGIIAGLTAVQVSKIKRQPTPEFRDGGFGQVVSGSDGGSYSDYTSKMFSRGGKDYFRNAGVMRGSRHGSKYGQRGIAMIDRQSGQEVGEAEDGEPFMILSRNTYGNNREVIDKLLYTSLHRNGKKIAYRDGGVSESPYFERKMYLFGSKKAKRAAEQAARDAEAEAKKAEAEAMQAEAAAQASYDGPTGGDEGDANGTGAANGASAEAQAQAEEAKKMAQSQLDLLEDIGVAVEKSGLDTVDALKALAQELSLVMKSLETTTQTSLEKLDTNTQASLTDLTTAVTEQLQKQDDNNGSGLEGLSEDITQGLKDLATSITTDLEKLGTQTETKLDEFQTEAITTLEKLEQTTKDVVTDLQTETLESLEQLEKTTKDSLEEFQKDNGDRLDELTKSNKETLEVFQKEAIQHIDDLAKTTESSLDELQLETVANLKELASVTKSSLDNLATETKGGLNNMADQVSGLKGSINAVEEAVRSVEGATRGVEGAIYGTNQSGRLDALLAAISNLK